MKIKKLLLLPLFAVSLLAGCTPDLSDLIMSNQEVLEQASNFGALLVNDATGVTYPDRSQEIKLNYGDRLIGARAVVVKGVLLEKDGDKIDIVVDVTYSINAESAELWKFEEQNPDEDHDLLEPTYPEYLAEDFNSTLTATFKFHQEGDEEVSDLELKVSWEVVHRAPRTEPKNIKIADFRNGVVEVQPGDIVVLRGFITAHFEEATPSDSHVYAGVFIADGDRAIMLYAGKLSASWFLSKNAVFKIGDLVEITGEYAPFNGLAEVEPSDIRKVNDPSIEQPIDLVIDQPATQWDKTYLTGHDGRITQFDNLIYKSATLNSVSAHGEIKFTAEGTNVEVLMYVNYHMGKTEKQKIHDMVATWQAGVTKINYHGILSWYNTPQLGPTNADAISVVS